MEYFNRLLGLLKTEQGADRGAYLKATEHSTAAQRREEGFSWYPIAIRGTEMSRGDYLSVTVERTTHRELAHQFRFGAAVALFSNHNRAEDRIEGTVAWQGGDSMRILLRTDELPDWSREGKLGVDLLFDELSYKEMEGALKAAGGRLEARGEEGRLAGILTGAEKPTFYEGRPVPPVTGLNAAQETAVRRIIEANELAIVHGPPGTGKTTTLVQGIKALLEGGSKRILVTAPSNVAVDLLSEKLAAAGLNVLRVGNPARVSERLSALTLDSRMTQHSATKDIKRLKKQAAEYKDMAHKYKRNFGKAERDQRKALFEEAHRIMKEVGATEQYIIDDLLGKAQVVTATLVGANHYTVRNLRYDAAVIDEAGQALEPASWIPALKAPRLILAGDHLQLPPTIKSAEAARSGLATTLLEKCVALHPEAVTMLEVQYRMNEAIMAFPSAEFYDGRLKAAPAVAGRRLFEEDDALAFVDTAGCGFEERSEGTSISNPEEAAFLFRHLGLLAEALSAHYDAAGFPSIAIISPYRQQIQVLQKLLGHAAALRPYAGRIAVSTIDSFQGSERDVVYISLTRSNSEGAIGFLADIRRMNVAMTRARKKLVVIGDSATLSAHPFYADFISYAQERNCYRSAWDYADY